MYCPSCGAEQLPDMSFCNRCGAKLSALKKPEEPKSLEKSINSTIWSIAGVTLSMLGVMVAVMAMMIGARLTGSIMILFMALMFLITLGIDGLFLWQLSGLKAQEKESLRINAGRSATKELESRQEKLLPEPQLSVTEGTTRSLKPKKEL
jgi:hypothetical protein